MIEEQIAQHLSDLLSQRSHRVAITIENHVPDSNDPAINPAILDKKDTLQIRWEGGAIIDVIYEEDRDGVLAIRLVFRNDARCQDVLCDCAAHRRRSLVRIGVREAVQRLFQ